MLSTALENNNDLEEVFNEEKLLLFPENVCRAGCRGGACYPSAEVCANTRWVFEN
jgi:hypothetical protein